MKRPSSEQPDGRTLLCVIPRTAVSSVAGLYSRIVHYFKRRWVEDRGDQYADWGCSMWYFEAGADGYPTRQMEVYENGKVLQYDQQHATDSFGGLCDQPLDAVEFASSIITQTQFEQAWRSHTPHNR